MQCCSRVRNNLDAVGGGAVGRCAGNSGWCTMQGKRERSKCMPQVGRGGSACHMCAAFLCLPVCMYINSSSAIPVCLYVETCPTPPLGERQGLAMPPQVVLRCCRAFCMCGWGVWSTEGVDQGEVKDTKACPDGSLEFSCPGPC